ncbi:hypothetical protein DQQ10_26535 [Pseudochryseolinea flava]|uniref:SprB repeat-containing protein n=2 Tax=Pseudochryseolinea flava TaxID=2059302 RepID=A0A364XVS8_9BACT|nr:hypothetical protein DQQ10_26535 [Pseudochryseolinea flava]
MLTFLTACVYHDIAGRIDCSKSNLTIQIDSVRGAASCSVANGIIYATVTGGEPPYQFMANNKLFETDSMKGLSPGIYVVKVIDALGCEAIQTNVTVPAAGFTFLTTFEPDTECLSNNGKVTIDIDQGNPPYVFSIDGGEFSADSTFVGLQFGVHIVKVSDVDECASELQVDVPRGASDVRWSTDIQPLLTLKCSDVGCHNGISRTNDFRKYKSAKKFAADIKTQTQNRSMPFEGSLTQDQIDIIACWVDDGAPEN